MGKGEDKIQKIRRFTEETFISMTEFEGKRLVLTSNGLYYFRGNKLIKVLIEINK